MSTDWSSELGTGATSRTFGDGAIVTGDGYYPSVRSSGAGKLLRNCLSPQ